jgi:hypothetical protein
MSPSTLPSTCMSPVVFKFPVIVRSLDKVEGGDFGFEELSS